MASYVAGVHDLNATVKGTNISFSTADDQDNDAYLPIVDVNGDDMQFILSENVINKLSYLVYNVSSFGKTSPYLISEDFVLYMDPKTN